MRRALALLGASALVITPTAAQQFVRDASALPSQTTWTDGVELVDVDADGDVDILFANGSAYGGSAGQGAQDQHLFLNDGTGSFTAAHGQLDHGANLNAKQVISGDFDNDGDPDLFYCAGSNNHNARLLLNDGAGNFTNATATNVPSAALRSFGCAAGDIDDDGDLDITISDGGTFGGQQAQIRLYLNDGTGVFTDVTATQMATDLYNCQDITMFDFDGDFDIDIAASGKGANGKRARLYLNDGNGNFTVDNALNALGSGSTYEFDWGDVDGDGDFDACVQSISGQQEGLGRNDGPGVAMPEITFPTPNGQDDNELAYLDIDNDGDLDCMVASLGSSGEKVYINGGTGGASFSPMHSLIQTITDSTLDFGFHDLDGNGTYDMVTGQGESGNFTNKVYFNNGPADTQPPIIHAVEAVGAIGATTTILHMQAEDSVQDDGDIYATAECFYTTDVGSGSVEGYHMGGGLFRAEIPTAGASTLSVDWCATDVMGNSSGACNSAWSIVGTGTNGVNGVPSLTGSGPLTAGSNTIIDLQSAAPSAIAALFLAVSSTPVPFKGGTLYTFPVAVTFNVATLPSRELTINFNWPAGVPSGFPTYWQYAIADAAAGPAGVALSNAILGTAP